MMSPDGEGHPRRWAILAVLSAVAFMAQLDLFIVNVALPAMGQAFGDASLSNLSWVLNAYSIVFAALLVPAARLADHHGRRRFLLVGVGIFTLASLVCALAPTLAVLVLGRVVQAVGAAMIVPTSLGLLLPAFAPRQHTLVVGIWAGVAAVAASSGPPVGGLLVTLDWRWIFIVNLPIGAAIILGGWNLLPEVRAERGARLPDPLSAGSVLAAIALFTLATVEGPVWGWTSAAELLLLVAAVAAAAISIWRTLTHPDALIEAALFQSAQFSSAVLALFLFFVGMAAWLLMTVLFLQNAWRYSALSSGLAIAPGPMTAAVFAVNSARVSARFGRRVPAVLGPLLVAAAGGFWLLFTPGDSDYLLRFMPGLILAGAGAGLTQAPLFAAASSLPANRATTGSGVLNMARQTGSALGVAMLVALLATAHPNELASYHRGWWFLIAATLAAAGVSAFFGRGGIATVSRPVLVD